jgi:hypothetical protein
MAEAIPSFTHRIGRRSFNADSDGFCSTLFVSNDYFGETSLNFGKNLLHGDNGCLISLSRGVVNILASIHYTIGQHGDHVIGDCSPLDYRTCRLHLEEVDLVRVV